MLKKNISILQLACHMLHCKTYAHKTLFTLMCNVVMYIVTNNNIKERI